MRLEERLLNGNQGGKYWYEEVEELSRIHRLYIVRIDELITRFRGEIEDNGRLIMIEEH